MEEYDKTVIRKDLNAEEREMMRMLQQLTKEKMCWSEEKIFFLLLERPRYEGEKKYIGNCTGKEHP